MSRFVFVVAAAPWIAGIAWFWRHRPHDGAIPPSMADRARERLSGRI